MKLLLDQNLSPVVGDRLSQAGVESAHVRDLGLHEASDEAILEYARKADLVVVSQDSDFTNLLAHQAASSPSVILLRMPNAVTASDIAAVLIANLGVLTEHLEAGAIASLNEQRIRVRRLPLR